MKIRFIPLAEWPTNIPATSYRHREDAKFSLDYIGRLNLLEKELTNINATDIVLKAFIAKSNIRSDGWPLASSRAAAPGIILEFMRHGTKEQSFVSDRYNDWRDNLYALAKVLEALRGIDRWLPSQVGAAYEGYRLALPAPAEDSFKTRHEALLWVFRIAEIALPLGPQNASETQIKTAIKTATFKTHPDTGGNHDDFIKLKQAIDLLR